MTDLSQATPEIAVFGSSSVMPGTAEWREAYRCGRLLAERGYAVVTGGYGGTMEAVSHGAADAGGHVVGVTAPTVFPARSGANAFVTAEEPATTLTERIHRLLQRTVGVIALPGSLGTFTELVMAWNLAHVAPLSQAAPKPIVAVGPGWGNLVGSIAVTLEIEARSIHCVDTVDAAVGRIDAALG